MMPREGLREPRFVLAPMDGMTHASFRSVCFEYGADGATTEMIQSLAYGRAKRRLSDTFLETLARFPGEGDLAAQLIGLQARVPAPEGQGTERGPRVMERGIEILQSTKMHNARSPFQR